MSMLRDKILTLVVFFIANQSYAQSLPISLLHSHYRCVILDDDFKTVSASSEDVPRIQLTQDGNIQVGIYLEFDFAAYSEVFRGDTIMICKWSRELIERTAPLFMQFNIEIFLDSIFIWRTEDIYTKKYGTFYQNQSHIAVLDEFRNQHADNLLSDLHFLWSPYIQGGLAYGGPSHRDQNSFANGGFGSDTVTSENIVLFAHEMGHALGGLPHTDACEWGPCRDKQLDDCLVLWRLSNAIDDDQDGLIDEVDEAHSLGCLDLSNPIIPSDPSGATIMSGCRAAVGGFTEEEVIAAGFGLEPGYRMYNGLLYIATDSPIAFHPDDRNALEEFYESANGANWKIKDGWMTSDDPRQWYGVELSPIDLRVRSINLADNGISGPIPPSLFSISSLEYLDLSSNQITGSIPNEILNLCAIKSIDLSFNEISGDLPDFSPLRNLQRVEISFNNLKGTITGKFDEMPALLHIGLVDNNLSGRFDYLTKITSLRSVWLSHNLISGDIPPEIENLQQIEYLVLENNMLDGSLPTELANLKSLNHLDITRNQLSGCYPGSLRQLCDLSIINVDVGNQFDATWSDFCSSENGICTTTSIGDQQERLLRLFPNPAETTLHLIGITQPSDFKIIDLSGRELEAASSFATNHLRIDITDILPGFYLLKIQTSKRIVIKPFMKL